MRCVARLQARLPRINSGLVVFKSFIIIHNIQLIIHLEGKIQISQVRGSTIITYPCACFRTWPGIRRRFPSLMSGGSTTSPDGKFFVVKHSIPSYITTSTNQISSLLLFTAVHGVCSLSESQNKSTVLNKAYQGMI